MVSFSGFATSVLTLTSLATATNLITTNIGCDITGSQLYPGYNCNIYSHKSSDKLGEDFFYSGYKNNALIGSITGKTGSPFYQGGQRNCFGVNLNYQTSFSSEFTAYYYADESGFHDISIDVDVDVEAAIYVGQGGFDCCNVAYKTPSKKVGCKKVSIILSESSVQTRVTKESPLLLSNAHLENLQTQTAVSTTGHIQTIIIVKQEQLHVPHPPPKKLPLLLLRPQRLQFFP
ncbi:hypothetical protein B5S30_g5477 [[Candida] boidinii]|nr:hypothetical protein B5S30_g5477 [[Candida] boidinii]